jgi:hydrogenase maturation protease
MEMRNMTRPQGVAASSQVAIVGVGNVLLSDEGVGIHVVRALREIPLPSYTMVFEFGTRGLEILEAAEGFRKMVIVDAVRSGAPPGTIKRWRLGELIDASAPRMTSLHEMDLLTILKIGRATAKLPDDVVIVGIEPKVLLPSLELSAELKAKFRELLDLVVKEASVP